LCFSTAFASARSGAPGGGDADPQQAEQQAAKSIKKSFLNPPCLYLLQNPQRIKIFTFLKFKKIGTLGTGLFPLHIRFSNVLPQYCHNNEQQHQHQTLHRVEPGELRIQQIEGEDMLSHATSRRSSCIKRTDELMRLKRQSGRICTLLFILYLHVLCAHQFVMDFM
jgi:hypothetical protein